MDPVRLPAVDWISSMFSSPAIILSTGMMASCSIYSGVTSILEFTWMYSMGNSALGNISIFKCFQEMIPSKLAAINSMEMRTFRCMRKCLFTRKNLLFFRSVSQLAKNHIDTWDHHQC